MELALGDKEVGEERSLVGLSWPWETKKLETKKLMEELVGLSWPLETKKLERRSLWCQSWPLEIEKLGEKKLVGLGELSPWRQRRLETELKLVGLCWPLRDKATSCVRCSPRKKVAVVALRLV